MYWICTQRAIGGQIRCPISVAKNVACFVSFSPSYYCTHIHTHSHTHYIMYASRTHSQSQSHTHSLFTHSFAHKNTTTAPYCNLIQSPQNSKPQAAQYAHSSAQYSQPTRTEGNSPQRAGVHARSSVEPRRCASVHHRCVQVGAT
jgi:hypothetical protein